MGQRPQTKPARLEQERRYREGMQRRAQLVAEAISSVITEDARRHSALQSDRGEERCAQLLLRFADHVDALSPSDPRFRILADFPIDWRRSLTNYFEYGVGNDSFGLTAPNAACVCTYASTGPPAFDCFLDLILLEALAFETAYGWE